MERHGSYRHEAISEEKQMNDENRFIFALFDYLGGVWEIVGFVKTENEAAEWAKLYMRHGGKTNIKIQKVFFWQKEEA